jgi:hypothetical protein
VRRTTAPVCFGGNSLGQLGRDSNIPFGAAAADIVPAVFPGTRQALLAQRALPAQSVASSASAFANCILRCVFHTQFKKKKKKKRYMEQLRPPQQKKKKKKKKMEMEMFCVCRGE